MYITTVTAILNICIITSYVAGNTAHIANMESFLRTAGPIFTNSFSYPVIAISCAGGHNITTAILAVLDSIGCIISTIRTTKVPSNTTYIMSAANIIFLINRITDIGVFSAAHYAAHITGIIEIIAALLGACHIAAVLYILYFAAAAAAGNAACIGNLYFFFANIILHATIFCICSCITGMEFINFLCKTRGSNITAVFRILHS